MINTLPKGDKEKGIGKRKRKSLSNEKSDNHRKLQLGCRQVQILLKIVSQTIQYS
jgi:hypothetical protein